MAQVCAVYFSPTGGTERTARTVGQGLADALELPLRTVDLTLPAARTRPYAFTETDLVAAVFPTYAGKLPNKLLPYLRDSLRGSGTLAVPVVTYGNRSFDNALAELTALLRENGFFPVSAAAFAVRHAFTDALGAGRPDGDDLRDMEAFAQKTAQAVRAGLAVQAEQPEEPLPVPGDPAAPYYTPRGVDGQPVNFLKAKPRTDPGRCCGCGVCARRCPMGAIDPADVSRVPGTCIKCQACVRRCTRRAKFFDDPGFLSHVAMLEAHFSAPGENRMFFPD